MLKIERQKRIEENLRTYGSILISTMSQQLNCSEETIRRDLKEMESANKLKRIHGGAYLPDADDKGVPIYLRETFLPEEKRKLATYTIDNFIVDNDTIMLDCSTTCLSIAENILKSNKKVTIITNSLRIFNLFSQQSSNVKLQALGGSFRRHSNSFYGAQTLEMIGHYLADKYFISCPAIDIRYGLLDNNLNESYIRKACIDHSRKHYLIADHTKFYDTADYIIDGLQNIDTIVTTKKLSNTWESYLTQKAVPFFYC